MSQRETKTKIVCRMGPASRAPETLAAMIEAGMNVARLNFAHGTFEEHAATIANVRQAARRTGRPVAILADDARVLEVLDLRHPGPASGLGLALRTLRGRVARRVLVDVDPHVDVDLERLRRGDLHLRIARDEEQKEGGDESVSHGRTSAISGRSW